MWRIVLLFAARRQRQYGMYSRIDKTAIPPSHARCTNPTVRIAEMTDQEWARAFVRGKIKGTGIRLGDTVEVLVKKLALVREEAARDVQAAGPASVQPSCAFSEGGVTAPGLGSRPSRTRRGAFAG